MNTITPLLSKMSERLDMPQPLKSYILLELAGDLEDLYASYRSRGMSEDEALRLAEEKIVVSDEAIELLIRMNDSTAKRCLRRFAPPVQRWIERISWGIVMLATFCVLYLITAHNSLFIGGPFALMMAGIVLALCGITISRLYILYIKKDHALKGIRLGLPFTLFLGGLSILIGINGFFVEILTVLDTMIRSDGNDVTHLLSSLQGAFFFVALSFFLATVAAVIWFVFTLKALTIEQHEKAVLYGKPLF